MDMIIQHDPDFVIYDYSTNDVSKMESIGSSVLRSLTEGVARAVLSLPKSPALLQFFLFRTVKEGIHPNVASMQAAAVEPVANYYNYSLISYRDAVWPVLRKPPKGGVVHFNWVHPSWPVHQLLADLACYAWMVVEENLPSVSTSSPVTPDSFEQHHSLMHTHNLTLPLPPEKFKNDDIEALKLCSDPMTRLEHKPLDDSTSGGGLERAPHLIGRGWHYVNKTLKEGWQYDYLDNDHHATPTQQIVRVQRRRRRLISPHPRKRSGSAAAGNIPWKAPAKKKRSPSPRRPGGANARKVVTVAELRGDHIGGGAFLLPTTLSFRVKFGTNPVLVVSYLRSYENFGKIVVILDDNRNLVLEQLRLNRLFREDCENRSSQDTGVVEAMATRPCMQMMHGFLDTYPFSLDGHWDDHSSQLAVKVFSSGYALARNVNHKLLNPPVYIPFKLSPLLVESEQKPVVGWHTVGFAMIREAPPLEEPPTHEKSYEKIVPSENNNDITASRKKQEQRCTFEEPSNANSGCMHTSEHTNKPAVGTGSPLRNEPERSRFKIFSVKSC